MTDAPIVEPEAHAEALPAEEPQPHGDLGGLRVVIVAWCFWLLGAWAVSWLSDSSTPRVRWMLFAGSIGLMLVWPAFRLSQRVGEHEPGRGALVAGLDWLAMVGVYQAVIWSLHLIAHWPIERGVWLDAAVVAWSGVTALIVATARLWPGAAARFVGMLLCLALVFAEPVAVWFWVSRGGEGWAMRISPVQALYELTDATRIGGVAPWDRVVLMVGVVAVAGWSALGLWSLIERAARRRNKPATMD